MKPNTERYCIAGEAVPVIESEVEPIEESVEEIVEETIEEIIEKTVEETVEEIVEESMTDSEPMFLGVVSDCTMLNIRSAPSKDADIVAVISVGTEVMIDQSADNEEWYGVWIATGVNGFCMKDYIAIKQ